MCLYIGSRYIQFGVYTIVEVTVPVGASLGAAMKISDFAFVALRVSSVFVFFYGLRQMINLIDYFVDGKIDRPFYIVVLYFLWAILPWVLASVLWFFPRTTFRCLSANDLSMGLETVGSVELLQVSIVVIGVFVFVGALPDLLFYSGEIIISMFSFGWGAPIGYQLYLNLFVNILELMMGLGFVFFSKKVLGLIGGIKGAEFLKG